MRIQQLADDFNGDICLRAPACIELEIMMSQALGAHLCSEPQIVWGRAYDKGASPPVGGSDDMLYPALEV